MTSCSGRRIVRSVERSTPFHLTQRKNIRVMINMWEKISNSNQRCPLKIVLQFIQSNYSYLLTISATQQDNFSPIFIVSLSIVDVGVRALSSFRQVRQQSVKWNVLFISPDTSLHKLGSSIAHKYWRILCLFTTVFTLLYNFQQNTQPLH